MAIGRHAIELARRMYIKDGCGLETIAKAVGASVATVKIWRNKGDWDILRKEATEKEYTTEELHAFAVFLQKGIEKTQRENGTHDKETAKLLLGILARLESLERVEQKIKAQGKKSRDESAIPKEVCENPKAQEALGVLAKLMSEHVKNA